MSKTAITSPELAPPAGRFSQAVVWQLVLVITFSVSLPAQIANSNSAQDACRHFVQEFYDWYLPNTHIKQKRKTA